MTHIVSPAAAEKSKQTIHMAMVICIGALCMAIGHAALNPRNTTQQGPGMNFSNPILG